MRYLSIPNELFIHNRNEFIKNIKPNSLAVFNSNPIVNTGADSTMPFYQHRDIFFLSGINQEDSILLLFPDAVEEKHREILFLRETNDHIAVWEGEKLTKQKAREISGIETIYWTSDFDSVFKILVFQSDRIYLNTNEHLRANVEIPNRELDFIKKCKEKYPLHEYGRISPIMHKIRSVKHKIELELLQRACDITEKGFRRLLKFVKPDVMEYELEAEMIHEFVCNRSKGYAYTPIIASGANACILHYIENNNKCKDGDMILIDAGAEYANYCSDMTRCMPVNGRFTDRQKSVYNAVLNVKKGAEELLRPGLLLSEYHKEVGKMMEKELLNLKLIDKTDIKNQSKDNPAYKKYFMHGTSHFLGLDTHDIGFFHEPIKENMVFTIEPGIYIREESLGIRLEDDVVIQSQGAPFNLMKNIPIEVEDIESEMMAR
ncbi:aminopeptidase P family protein [Ichthyobacterium seriolicida]|uniref:Xaa-Pro aminopeptidase n=1 Tax=Ichthyobacterium seriolicida TaxID=242600 RepID=A0A1J1E287_9FLAO|nr:aminopeptidase P family protein [Ichthyobacterium seriolicida]BAV95069.1 Xaa-pro aminopeptidase [Ichthyobacterium seriolicida]